MLTFGAVTYFHEDQHFQRSWLLLIIAVPIVVLMVAVASAPRVDAAGIAIGIGVCVLFPLLLGFARLETEVRDDAVYVHFHGLWPTRRLPLGEIASYEARRYSIWDSAGWGVHLGLAGMTYNVSGNEGVQFRLKNGNRVLVGTRRPQDFAAGIAKALEARRAR